MSRKHRSSEASGGLWLYGLHAVRAALANPRRAIRRAVLTERAAEEIGRPPLGRGRHEIGIAQASGRLLPPGSVHQGAALLCEPLPRRDMEDVLAKPAEQLRLVLVLDPISDTHNVGAILRAAGVRRTGEVRFRRARHRALFAGGEYRPRPGGTGQARLLAHGARE